MIKTPKGCYDRGQEESILKNKIVDVIRETYEKYGFDPLETSILQRFEVLSKKGAGGREVLDQTYNFKDKAGRHLGLRYDLTVPMARYVAENKDLMMPFKRYQISRVYRYEAVGKGHKREFWQADIDVIGSESMLADATSITACHEALKKIGFEDLVIKLNNRKVLEAFVRYAGVGKNKIHEAFRAIDKLDKIGIQGVKNELQERGIKKSASKEILDLIRIKGDNEKKLKKASQVIEEYKIGRKGIKELKELSKYLRIFNIDFEIDLTLARGLDYYTGPIFETFIKGEEDIGAIAGGGRYDNLIKIYSNRNLPAVGMSIGIERILELARKRNLIEEENTLCGVYVAPVSNEVKEEALEVLDELRSKGIRSEIDLRDRSLSNQLDYVNSKEIRYVIIVGKRDLEEGNITLKDMEAGKEKEIGLSEFKEDPKSYLR